jgi:hypothetical protein
MLNIHSIIVLAVIALLTCCKPANREISSHEIQAADSTAGFRAADTITYQVIIKNSNPDDLWTTRCLAGLNRTAFIDSIFNMVYLGKALAYNYETLEKLTPAQIKDLESATDYSREEIGMIQFTEAWVLNTQRNQMSKKVLSMVLGYNFYSSTGELVAHKPMFRVEMNE